jgi:hypothetical protein
MAWRISLTLTIAALAGAALGAPAGAASTRFVLHESVAFTGGNGTVGTFKATGIPGCASGTFADTLVTFSANGANLVVDRAYTCNHRGGRDGVGGEGTFTAKMALHLSVVDHAGKQTGRGSWTIIRSSGALHGLSATGSERGIANGCTPVGTALAQCDAGTDSVTATRKAL